MGKVDFTSAQLWAKIDAIDERRETAYKGILIICLCISLSSWVAIGAVGPVLYQFVNLSNTQMGHVLEFCEDTVTTVVKESRELFEAYGQYSAEERRKIFEKDNNETHALFKRNHKDDCNCNAPPGPAGLPGRPGLLGSPGTPGTQGKPAVLPCQPPPDYKKWCPEPCPSGPQGPPGNRGSLGDKGAKGEPGKNGAIGENGKRGPAGPRGKPGTPGFDGEEGDAGMDQEAKPFIPGPPGPQGDSGPQGPPGPRGMPGLEGPQGPMGPRGQGGRNGIPGQRGLPGLQGISGDPGKEGEKGVCPTYCANDGGVFFVEPPEWFFNEKH